MPILDLHIVGRATLDLPAAADRLAELLGSAPGTLWLRLHELAPAHYAENGGPADGDPPVFVCLLLRQWPELEARALLARRLAEAVGALCGRPAERVHIEFAPPGAGRIAFGGTLVR